MSYLISTGPSQAMLRLLCLTISSLVLQGRGHQYALRAGASVLPQRASVLDPTLAVELQAVASNVNQQEFLRELKQAGVKDLPDAKVFKEIVTQAFMNAESIDDFLVNLNNSVPARALASKLKTSVLSKNGAIRRVTKAWSGYLNNFGMDDIRYGAELSGGILAAGVGADFFIAVCSVEDSCGKGVSYCIEPHGDLTFSKERPKWYSAEEGLQIGTGKYAYRSGSFYTLAGKFPRNPAEEMDTIFTSQFAVDKSGWPSTNLTSAAATWVTGSRKYWPSAAAGMAHGFCIETENDHIAWVHQNTAER